MTRRSFDHLSVQIFEKGMNQHDQQKQERDKLFEILEMRATICSIL